MNSSKHQWTLISSGAATASSSVLVAFWWQPLELAAHLWRMGCATLWACRGRLGIDRVRVDWRLFESIAATHLYSVPYLRTYLCTLRLDIQPSSFYGDNGAPSYRSPHPHPYMYQCYHSGSLLDADASRRGNHRSRYAPSELPC